jgi:Tol biopolymer transport system component
MLVPPHGGQERSLGEIHIRQNNAIPTYLTWFPDSRALVVVHSSAPDKPDALFVMSIETLEKQALTYPPAADVFDTAPAVSPDGRTVAFIRGHELNVIGIGDHYRASTPPQPLTQRALGDTASPAWTPDGKEIVYVSYGSLWRIQASGGQSAAPVPLAGQDAFMPVLSRSAFTRSTRLAFARAAFDPNIWRLDLTATGALASSGPVRSITSTRLDASPQFSPDGKRVAFRSTRTGSSEIWIADPDGANSVPLTSMGRPSSGSPGWSLDGQWIAFDSNAEGQWEIYVVAASGGRPRRMTFEPGEDSIPSFSTDGRFIYFTSKRSGVFEIWKMPVSGGDAERVTQNGGVVALESKDGHLYYTQAHHGPSSLWRMPASGGRPQKLLDGVRSRAFQVFDRGIYYVERYGGDGRALWGLQSGFGFLRSEEQFRLQFFDFASAKSTFVADLPGPLAMGLAVSSDARTVLFTRVDSTSSDLMMVENFR